MTLDLALKSAGRLSSLVVPELTRLVAAKKRVLDRWPDIVPDPPEKDQEAIVAQMRDLLQRDNWADVKMSFVLRALKVAFSNNFRDRKDVDQIIRFAFEELEATTQATFLNAMVSIYLFSFQPKAEHSRNLGRKIAKKSELLNGKWRAIKEAYPRIFEADDGHLEIATSMVKMDEPWLTLKAQGFPNPHAPGLMDHVHDAYLDNIRENLKTEDQINLLFKWLNPEPGKRKQSGSVNVIEAVLGHWLQRTPSDELRQIITEHLINQYNDPRTSQVKWTGVTEELMNVIFSWLTREDLRFFISVVDATQRDPQWQPRKKFWLRLFDEGLIEQAWVAFCPSAERYARENLVRNGFTDNTRRFARQTKRKDTSILIMKIGSKIVVDGCHSYKTHVFNLDDPNAPKLFRREYDCDDDVMHRSQLSKAHIHIPSWSDWVREAIRPNSHITSSKLPRRLPRRRPFT